MDKYALADQTKSRNIIPLLAALWATLVAAYLYLASTYDLSVVYFGLDTSQFELVKNRVIAYAKVVAVTGPGSAFGLTIPVFLALLPLAVRKHRLRCYYYSLWDEPTRTPHMPSNEPCS
jgi:hypothetical protein